MIGDMNLILSVAIMEYQSTRSLVFAVSCTLQVCLIDVLFHIQLWLSLNYSSKMDADFFSFSACVFQI